MHKTTILHGEACKVPLLQIFTLQPQYIRDLDDTVQLLVANMEEVVTR